MTFDEKLEKGAVILFDDDPLANMVARGLGRGATALGRATKAGLQKLRGGQNYPEDEMPSRELPERDFPTDTGPTGAGQDWSWLKDILSSIASDISSIRQNLIEQSQEQTDNAESERLRLIEDQIENKNERPQLAPTKPTEETKSGYGLLGLLGIGLSSLTGLLGSATSLAGSLTGGVLGSAIAGGVTGLASLAADIVTAMPLASVVALVGAAFLTWWKYGGGADAATKGLVGDGSVVDDPKQGKIVVGPKPEDATITGDLAATAALVGNKIGLPTGITDEQLTGITEGLKLRELRQRMSDNQKAGEGADSNYWNQSGFFSDAGLSDKARSKIFGQLDSLIGERLRQGDMTRAVMVANGNRKSADMTQAEAKAQGEIVTEGLSKIINENISNLQKEYDSLTKTAPFKYEERGAIRDQIVQQENLLRTLENYNNQLKDPEKNLAETIAKINKSLEQFEKDISGGTYGGFGDYGRGSRTINLGKDFSVESSSIDTGNLATISKGNLDSNAAQKALQISKNLGIKPEWLMAAMDVETGGTFSPSIKNQAGSGATGLIQFMPSTASGLGTSTEALSKMSQIEQLDYVEKYLKPFAGKINSPEDMYMSILYPKALGKGNDYSLFSRGTKEYSQNAGLDINRDGIVNKQEAASSMVSRVAKYTAQPIPKAVPDLENSSPASMTPAVIPIPLAQPAPAPSMSLAMAGGNDQKQSAVNCTIDGSVRAACS